MQRLGASQEDRISNNTVETWLRRALTHQGFVLSAKREHGENGVDICVTKGQERWHIEVIGYKNRGSARSKDFYEVFFRAVSRLNDNAKHCVIAMPSRGGQGLPLRAKQHEVAWLRIAKAFPELEIWLVDPDDYKPTTWREWVR